MFRPLRQRQVAIALSFAVALLVACSLAACGGTGDAPKAFCDASNRLATVTSALEKLPPEAQRSDTEKLSQLGAALDAVVATAPSGQRGDAKAAAENFHQIFDGGRAQRLTSGEAVDKADLKSAQEQMARYQRSVVNVLQYASMHCPNLSGRG